MSDFREMVFNRTDDDSIVTLMIGDIISETPLAIQVTDMREGSTNEFGFSLNRLSEAEDLAKEILEQVAYIRAVKKRSDDLSAMFVQMAKNAQENAKAQVIRDE